MHSVPAFVLIHVLLIWQFQIGGLYNFI